MKIEVVRTLKGDGGELYSVGAKFSSPDIPGVLLGELRANSGVVKVIEYDPPPKLKRDPEPVPMPVVEIVAETEPVPMPVIETEPEPEPVPMPEPSFVTTPYVKPAVNKAAPKPPISKLKRSWK